MTTVKNSLSRSLIFAAALLGFPVAAFGQCTFTVSPSPAYVDSTAQTSTFQVTASSQTCTWTAASSGFATVSGSAGATGNGSVNYSVTANTTNADRSVNLTIAGNTVTLNQDFTPSTFSDVFPSDYYFDGANVLRQDNITAGCATTPTLQYCPAQNVTRGQMAIFVVRTMLGGGANVDNFSYSATPYFTDVPTTYPYFKWIQKLRDLGVTAGCSATQYCPNDNITRGQMAVFIIRLRLGSSTAFTYQSTPYFTDVPANYAYFTWIQKMKELGITGGCTLTTYCPNNYVTRGDMSIFLVRSGFNTLLSLTAPLLTSAAPNSGSPGSTVTVALTGINTNFVQGTTTVTAPPGITVGTVTVTNSTHLSVALTIPATTPLGPISLTAVTNTEQATLPNGFLIGYGDPVPTITSFSPTSGPVGTSVTLMGTGLVSSSGTAADVRMALQGGGIVSAPLTTSSTTSLTFVVPSTAASGTITVAGSSGSATSTASFTITPSSTFTLTASPSSLNLIAGQTSTYTVTAGTTNGFTGLVQLSLSGLPSGLVASFNPVQITAGQQSTLTITAPSTQTATTAPLVITGAATVSGLAESLSANVTLNVTPITTSFLGRTVVDNTTNTTLVGVTVSMMGQDGAGHSTGCTGSTVSDGSGNFALTGLASSCVGPQMVAFNGSTVTSPAGTYAGLNLVFTLVSAQVVVSPVLVHLPRVDTAETFMVTQNSTKDQSYTFKTIPGLSVTVYAGTVFTLANGMQPNPFPLQAIEVPVDRLPDVMPVSNSTVAAFIVAFQPVNTTASNPVAVYFPNTLNTPPGTDMPLMTLDPTKGRMVSYGTGTVSNDGTTIIPDIDPSTGTLYHRYGIVHFDWHGPVGGPGNQTNPSPGSNSPSAGEPVELSSGLEVVTSTDIAFSGHRGSIALTRTYRTLATQGTIPGPFGWGSFHNFEYRLDTLTPQSASVINLILPNGAQVPFALQTGGTLINTTVPDFAGWVMTTASNGTTTLTQKNGAYFQFVPGIPPTGSVLVSVADPNGNITNIVRPSGAPYQITEIDDPVGRKLTFQYSGYVISKITDPIGRTVSYTYNSAGYLATYTNVLGGVTSYQYDSQGRLAQITDPDGAVTKNSFDSNGRVSSQVLPSGGTMTFAYTLVNSLVPTSPVTQTVVTDPLGNMTTYRFNTQGFLISVTDATGQVRTFTRQLGSNLVLALTGTGNCPVCGDPKAGDMTFTYDGNGNLLTRADAMGDTWNFTYDPVFNKVTSAADPMGNVTSHSYDSHGNLVKTTDARGNSTAFNFNGNGLMISAQDAAGNTTTMTYDSIGNLISVLNPLGQKTQFSYDGASRMIAQLDPLGRTSAVALNPGDQPTTITDANGNTMQLSYDTAGLLSSFTDGKGGKTTITHDAAERVSLVTDPLNRVLSYQYDANSDVVAFTNRRGQQATYAYDALSRIVSETYADSTVQRVYDSSGRTINVVDSQSGTFGLTYDLAGRLLKVVGPNGTISYTRDLDGRVSSRQVSGQPSVGYTYDADGNVTKATMGTTSVTRTFDARNHLATDVRSNGVSGAYTYDMVGRVLAMSQKLGANALFSRTYTYDAAGQITGTAVDTGLSLSTQSAAGAFDADNEITAYGATTYTSDADGNRLTEAGTAGTTSYTWDARGRLQAVLSPTGVVTSFLYDPNSQMVQERVTSSGSDTIQRFILDDAYNIVSVQQGESTITSVLDGRGPDDIMATVQGTTSIFPLLDQIASEGAFTDGSGNVVGREYYEPYGAPTASGTAGLFQFVGRPVINGNLIYDRARFYDSTTGRFLSEDPARLGGGTSNLYQYAGGNPIGARDPSGECLPACLPLVTGGLGAVFGAVGNGLGQLAKNGTNNFSWADVGIAAGTGFVAGALAPSVGATWVGAIALGALSNVAGQAISNVAVHNQPIQCGLLWAGITGAAGGAIGGPFTGPTGLLFDTSGQYMDAGLAQSLNNDAYLSVIGSGLVRQGLGTGVSSEQWDPLPKPY